MTTDQLELFLDLCQTQHFGKTALRWHISASNLSRSIQKLEEELNCSLFERNNRHVYLTEAGKAFQQVATDTLRAITQFKQINYAHPEDMSGVINLYCSVTASYSVLLDILKVFKHRFPKIHIQLETGFAENTIAKIQNQEADLGIAVLNTKPPKDIFYKPLWSIPIVIIRSKESRYVVSANSRWNDVPFILPAYGQTRALFDQWARHQPLSPQIYSEVAGYEGIISLVHLDFGWGVVPEMVYDKSPLKHHLDIIETAVPLPRLEVGICCKKAFSKTPLIEAFINTLYP